MYVVLFVPAFIPLTFHWYAGAVPPFVGVAVKVTDVPEQTGLTAAAIEMSAVTKALTFIVFPAETPSHVPPLAVRVKVAIPLNPDGGVQVAFKSFALGANIPPMISDVQVALTAGRKIKPPKGSDTPPWHISCINGPTSTHWDRPVPTNSDKFSINTKTSFFILIGFRLSLILGFHLSYQFLTCRIIFQTDVTNT